MNFSKPGPQKLGFESLTVSHVIKKAIKAVYSRGRYVGKIEIVIWRRVSVVLPCESQLYPFYTSQHRHWHLVQEACSLLVSALSDDPDALRQEYAALLRVQSCVQGPEDSHVYVFGTDVYFSRPQCRVEESLQDLFKQFER